MFQVKSFYGDDITLPWPREAAEVLLAVVQSLSGRLAVPLTECDGQDPARRWVFQLDGGWSSGRMGIPASGLLPSAGGGRAGTDGGSRRRHAVVPGRCVVACVSGPHREYLAPKWASQRSPPSHPHRSANTLCLADTVASRPHGTKRVLSQSCIARRDHSQALGSAGPGLRKARCGNLSDSGRNAGEGSSRLGLRGVSRDCPRPLVTLPPAPTTTSATVRSREWRPQTSTRTLGGVGLPTPADTALYTQPENLFLDNHLDNHLLHTPRCGFGGKPVPASTSPPPISLAEPGRVLVRYLAALRWSFDDVPAL